MANAFTEKYTETFRQRVTLAGGFGSIPDELWEFGDGNGSVATTTLSNAIFWNGAQFKDPAYPLTMNGVTISLGATNTSFTGGGTLNMSGGDIANANSISVTNIATNSITLAGIGVIDCFGADIRYNADASGHIFSGDAGVLIENSLNVQGSITGNGSSITGLNASNISIGTVGISRLPNLSSLYLSLSGGVVGGTTVFIGNETVFGDGSTNGFIKINDSINELSTNIYGIDNGLRFDHNGSAGSFEFYGYVSANSFAGAFAGNGSAITNINANNITTGTVSTARLGSGTANSTTYLRGDGAWATVAGGIGGSGGNSAFEQTFNATTDWGTASGGKYTITVNHNFATYAISVQVWNETTGKVVVIPDTISMVSNNAVAISVPQTPENRFTGRVVIIANGAISTGFSWACHTYSTFSAMTTVTASNKLSGTVKAPLLGGSVKSYTLNAGTYLVKSFITVNGAALSSVSGTGLVFSSAPNSYNGDAVGSTIFSKPSTGVIYTSSDSFTVSSGGASPLIGSAIGKITGGCSVFSGIITGHMTSYSFTITSTVTATPVYHDFANADGIYMGWIEVSRIN